MTFFSNGKVGQISSSELTISNGSWEGKSHGLHAQYSSINALNTNISVGENHGTALAQPKERGQQRTSTKRTSTRSSESQQLSTKGKCNPQAIGIPGNCRGAVKTTDR